MKSMLFAPCVHIALRRRRCRRSGQSLLFAPCVYIAGEEYQIIFATEKPGMAWVTVGDKKYADSSTGLMRWKDVHHRVCVPMAELDKARGYTVHFAAMEDRLPYYPVHDEVESKAFSFAPMDTKGGVKLYHIADTHGDYEHPIACAKQFPEHTLVFNGDIADHNTSAEDLYLLFKINEQVTGGEKPILFARGNHDTRGPAACILPELIPTVHGNTFFTFRTGDLFGVSLDCGEDKPDAGIEYGDTVDFEPYRQSETAFLEEVASSGAWKDAPYRIAICHIPFTRSFEAPFNIEQETYRRWTQLLNEMQIDALICGHMHRYDIILPGDGEDKYGQIFPTVVGSSRNKERELTGAAIDLTEDGLRVRMTGPDGTVHLDTTIARK